MFYFTNMRKEVFFAIFIGLIVGLLITLGIYNARKAFVEPNNTITTSPTPLPSPTPFSSLKVIKPEHGTILSQKNTIIEGKTEPSHIVVVFVNEKEYITQANETGIFQIETELEAGGNAIRVVSLAEDGSKQETKIDLIVSTVSLDNQETQESTSSAETETTTEGNNEE